MWETRGAALLVLVLLAGFSLNLGRAALRDHGPPAFSVQVRPGIPVELADGFPLAGIHQISDGSTPFDVIKMAALAVAPQAATDPSLYFPMRSGERLSLHLNAAQVVAFERNWMPSGRRVALGVPLHPDRMSTADWQILPGIGPRLAERIEEDRQKNGDFGSLEALARVSGIGSRRIESWREFFSPPQEPETSGE